MEEALKETIVNRLQIGFVRDIDKNSEVGFSSLIPDFTLCKRGKSGNDADNTTLSIPHQLTDRLIQADSMVMPILMMVSCSNYVISIAYYAVMS